MNSTLGTRLVSLRAARNLTQEELSTASGVSRSRIAVIERNHGGPPQATTMAKLAKGLGVAVAVLYGELAATVADAPPLATATAEVVTRLIEQLTQQSQEHRAELATSKKDARATFETTIKALQFTLETLKTTIVNERQTVLELKHDIYHLRLAAGQRQPTVEEQEYMDRQAQRKGKPAGFKSYEPTSRFSVGVAA